LVFQTVLFDIRLSGGLFDRFSILHQAGGESECDRW